jgi:hypothetical protein
MQPYETTAACIDIYRAGPGSVQPMAGQARLERQSVHCKGRWLRGKITSYLDVHLSITQFVLTYWSPLVYIMVCNSSAGGTRWRSWLKNYATSRKVAGSIPGDVIGFFSWPNTSSRTTTGGSTQPLTEMSTRNLPESKVQPAHKADNLMGLHGLLQE